MERCNQQRFESLSAYHDGEVTRDDARRIEAHLATCAACRRDAERLAMISEHLLATPNEGVPARVRAAAEASVHGHSARRRWAWGVAAAVAVAAAAVVVASALAVEPRDLPAAVSQEILLRHLGGFARSRPCDIESSDPQVVSAWLTEHAGYPVSVQVASDTQLLGGRMCRLCGDHAAAVMLRRGGTPLTIFVPPPNSDAARQAEHLAEEGLRCTAGPVGSAICASSAPQPMLAVAEGDSSQVSAALVASVP
jgi:anti-sigma factor RsiW